MPENAIRRFANFRDDAALLTREKGLKDYLVLLRVFQTCRYKAVNFGGSCFRGRKTLKLSPLAHLHAVTEISSCIRPASSTPLEENQGAERRSSTARGE
jgi:hypothetical protein